MFINKVNFLYFILRITNVHLKSIHLDVGSCRSGNKNCQYVDKIFIVFSWKWASSGHVTSRECATASLMIPGKIMTGL